MRDVNIYSFKRDCIMRFNYNEDKLDNKRQELERATVRFSRYTCTAWHLTTIQLLQPSVLSLLVRFARLCFCVDMCIVI